MLFANRTTVIFTGHITSNIQQQPVAFYPVYISSGDDSTEYVMAVTNENGVYFEEVEVDSGAIYFVSVYDCEEVEHYKEFDNVDSVNVADFNICVSPENCSAYFEEEQDSANPLGYYFYNLSSGNYSMSIWDFGDGQSGYDPNPYHVFPEEGVYNVSLFIADTLSPIGCSDYYEQEVVVGSQPQCVADFSYALDTLNNTPLVYVFNNQSLGDSLFYFWDFGDDEFSEEESPQHTYLEGGEYQVTLYIQNFYGYCYDEITKTIVTPDYFNFGGQVFLGDVTMNIEPDDSANVATAYLYRKMQGRWHFMDKRDFWQLGYYWFTEKPEGDYLINIALHQGSEDYDNYAPGYYKHVARWQNASVFTLSGDAFEKSVNLVKLDSLGNGLNTISGYTVFDSTQNGHVTDTLSNVLVQLLNQQGNIVKYTYSNSLGAYGFDGLPDGNYYVRGEVVGICSGKTAVSLSSGNPFADNVAVAVFDCGNIGIDETPVTHNQIAVNLFPVPASNELSLQINAPSLKNVKIDIYNLLGKNMESIALNIEENSMLKVDVSSWPTGIYLVNILSNNNNKLLSKKFIISR